MYFLYSDGQRLAEACWFPGLCVDSTLLCCCGQYSFSTQWDREVSMDVSLAKGKSHYISVADAVKHMPPFKASLKVFLFKGQIVAAGFTHFLLNSASGTSHQYCPPVFYLIQLLWHSGKQAWGKWKSIDLWPKFSSPEQGAGKTIESSWWLIL